MKNHNSHLIPAEEHNPTGSYIIGFVLSLIFTLIPYSLVVNKTLSGNQLTAVILGFAIVQMLIQIFFFLHLGRGPKPFYNIVFFAATVGLIIVTVGGSIFIMNNLYNNMSTADTTLQLAQKEGIERIGDKATGACQGVLDNHTVVIEDGTITPNQTTAKRCDTLTISNRDETASILEFRESGYRTTYGGSEEIEVREKYSKTITLNQTGMYEFYDQNSPLTSGAITVEP